MRLFINIAKIPLFLLLLCATIFAYVGWLAVAASIAIGELIIILIVALIDFLSDMKLKKVVNKDYTISWKEKTSSGVKEKSFHVEKKNVAWHVKNLSKVPEVCYDVNVEIRKGV